MNATVQMLVVTALFGSALVAGVFFAFSSFIMKALAQRPAPEGIAAMQAINVTVINRSFLGAFIGTAVISGVLIVLVLLGHGASARAWVLLGGANYLLGTFGVTALGNIPLNDALARANPEDAEGAALWTRYLHQWTRLNTLRTVAAVAASAFFLAALMVGV